MTSLNFSFTWKSRFFHLYKNCTRVTSSSNYHVVSCTLNKWEVLNIIFPWKRNSQLNRYFGQNLVNSIQRGVDSSHLTKKIFCTQCFHLTIICFRYKVSKVKIWPNISKSVGPIDRAFLRFQEAAFWSGEV